MGLKSVSCLYDFRYDSFGMTREKKVIKVIWVQLVMEQLALQEIR